MMCDFGYGIWQDAFDEGEMKHAKESALRLQEMGLMPDQIAKVVDFDLETVKQWLSEAISA